MPATITTIVSIDKGFIVGVINSIAWGLGYVLTGRYFYGGLWLVAYALVLLSMFFAGYIFYVDTATGNLLLMAFSAVSAAFLYDGIEKDVRSNDSRDRLKVNLPVFVLTVLTAGAIQELANEFYLHRWWAYLSPWSLLALPGTRIGPLLLIGWLILLGISLSITYFLAKTLRTGIFKAWIAAWVATGFIVETFNAVVWRTWYYREGTMWKALVIPGLDYGILVPLVGYGGTAVLGYFVYIVTLKLITGIR